MHRREDITTAFLNLLWWQNFTYVSCRNWHVY